MIRILSLSMICIVFLCSCSREPYIDDFRKEKVSFTTLELNDSARERPLSTKIWYPTNQSALEKRQIYDDGYIGFVAEEAAVRDVNTTYPLVLLSHGTGGSNSNLSWLAEILASNGFIVASPNHWNNTATNNQPSGIVRLWDRPKDLSFLLDFLLSDPKWGSLINEKRIYAAGFSAGGFTVLGLAGAKYSIEKMGKFCGENPSDSGCAIVEGIDFSVIDVSDEGDDYKDSRIKAVLAMAPAVGEGILVESLRNISIPVVIFAAEDDELLSVKNNAELYANYIPSASLQTFERGGHFVFMQECSLIAKVVVKLTVKYDVCGLSTKVDRRELQHDVATAALKLFGDAAISHNKRMQPTSG